jgi:drug/metabolite transporter (DMT)-like permease
MAGSISDRDTARVFAIMARAVNAPTRSGRPTPLLTTVLVAVLCLVWGSTWLVIKTGLATLPPMWSAALRFGVAAIAMALVAPAIARREGGAAPPWWLSATVGLLGFALSYALVYATETVLPSGLVSVLWAVFPILQAVLGHVVLPDERLVPRQWIGFAVGFVGVAVLFASDLRGLGAAAIPMAALLLLSPAASAVSSTLVKKHGGHVSWALLNRNAMAIGALALALVSVVLEPGERGTWTGTAVFSVGYLALVGTVVTFGLYYWLLRWSPANRLSLIAYVTPPVALALGWALGDEPLTPSLLAGTALVLVGVALTRARRRRGARA